jgi:hypothetical protein
MINETKATPDAVAVAYPPLELETRFSVNTATAAFHCNRRPQTLRAWACLENGPIRPIRVHGRLAWSVDDIRQLLGCAPTSGEIKSVANSHTKSGVVDD